MKRSERFQMKATRAMWMAVLVMMLWLAACAGGWRMCQEFEDLPVILPSVVLGCVAGLCFVVRGLTDAVSLRRRARLERKFEDPSWVANVKSEIQF